MTEDEMKKEARKRVSEARPLADKISISLIDEFFNGVVAMVEYEDGPVHRRDFIYFDQSKR